MWKSPALLFEITKKKTDCSFIELCFDSLSYLVVDSSHYFFPLKLKATKNNI